MDFPDDPKISDLGITSCQNWYETKSNETWSASIITKDKWKNSYSHLLSKLSWDSELPNLDLEEKSVLISLVSNSITGWIYCAYRL